MQTSGLLAPALLVGMFFLMLRLEETQPLRPTKHRKTRRIGINLGLAFFSLVTAKLLFLPGLLAVSTWAVRNHYGLASQLPEVPGLRFLVAWLLFDYTLYFWHRMNHRLGFLWRFHNVHHVDLEMDVSTASRFHFGEIGLSAGFRCFQVLLIGLDPMQLLWFETISTLAAQLHHGNVKLPIRIEQRLVRWLVTPRMHAIHHSVVPAEVDSNFSTVFSVWDRWHRTVRLNIPSQELRLGGAGYRNSAELTLVRMLTLPFAPVRPPRFADGSLPRRDVVYGPPDRLAI